MFRYIIKRTIQAIPLIFGITVLTYLLMTAAPGGPIGAMNFKPTSSPQERARLAARLGVNDPWPVQYLRWLLGDDWMRWDADGDGVADHSFLLPLDADGDGEAEPPGIRHGALRGDFGDSFVARRPVLDILFERLPATLELGIGSLVIGVTVGIVIGILAAVRRGGWFDNVTRVMAVVFDAIPSFWLGLLLILFFGVQLQLLPLQGRCKPTISDSVSADLRATPVHDPAHVPFGDQCRRRVFSFYPRFDARCDQSGFHPYRARQRLDQSYGLV